jgi:CRISPR-associated protein Csm3
MVEFVANIIFKGKIECLTGLHIGGSKEKVEVGGVDSPVIRDVATGYPYIPGSSLKGKMRMLLEFSHGLVTNGEVHTCEKPDCKVCRIFGSSAKERKVGPTRLIIRDAYPDKETIEMWNNLDTDLLYTELKVENSIDRITSAANPRQLERVVKGSKFDFEIVYGIYKIDSEENILDIDYFQYVLNSLKLLEHSTLGGSGSRGYGQIKFYLSQPYIFTKKDYQENKAILPEYEKIECKKLLNEIIAEDIKNELNKKLGEKK